MDEAATDHDDIGRQDIDEAADGAAECVTGLLEHPERQRVAGVGGRHDRARIKRSGVDAQQR